MSYDIWLEVDLGGVEPARIEGPYWNYTSNVAPMWHMALPETDGLAGMDGMLAGVAAEHLARAIANMKAHPDAYRALNPANGWGDFDGQLEKLCILEEHCRTYPAAKVAISR